ncbi:hypothetical protein [Dactylosporangium sp. CA-092794]|uniref:hypothetical protein n=1 Tax=Dactylosporangium sp. CA-092794 TaxID=3239929 RepID=UPI003D93F4BE
MCAALLVSGCANGGTPAAKATPSAGSALLTPADLPDGYTVSPPDPAPEVSAASSASVAGCDALLDYFRGGSGDGGGQTARFEAGAAGPFLSENIAPKSEISDLAANCWEFTDVAADGTTTTVHVTQLTDFPEVANGERAFRMEAAGGTGDDAFALSGYLVVASVGGATCTIVHFGQPGVDRAETERIARAAVTKIKQRQ